MSFLTAAPGAAQTRPEGAGFGDALRERHMTWRTYRHTCKELQSLSDRELNDLGLHRSGIRTVAYEAAYGKA